MLETRWLRWVGPGLVAIGALGLVTSAAVGAGVRPWTPRACGGGASERTAAAQVPGPASPADLRSQAWFRIDPVIDDAGTLQGQSVSFGLDGAGAARTVELPAESFASGPFGRIVLIGSDDGSVSQLRAIDVVTGCTWTFADEAAVIRRATMDAAGGLVYEARVDRVSRTDLGVWSRPFGGVAPASPVLPPIGPDDRFGRTFSTEFSWSTDGRALAVQSCGEVACRTRIVGLDGRPGQELVEPDLGLLAGFDGERIVTYTACRGLPCPIIATDLASGARRVLADEAGLAAVVETSEGPRLVHETFDAGGLRLTSVSLDDGTARDLGPVPAGLRLESTPDRTGGATRSPIDWIVLVPDRDSSVDAVSLTPQLRHLSDGATVALDEVVR